MWSTTISRCRDRSLDASRTWRAGAVLATVTGVRVQSRMAAARRAEATADHATTLNCRERGTRASRHTTTDRRETLNIQYG